MDELGRILDKQTLDVFTPKYSQVAVFSVVTKFSDVVGYQRFEGPCCLRLQGDAVVIHFKPV
jgi:hypothetical protein